MSSEKFTVIGAGMAGLLAAAILRDKCERVVEAQEGLPNNHHAVLRFRSSIVADTVNIPFKRVSVMKASAPWKNPVADAMAYSRKTNGSYTLRSSTTANGEIVERYVAPPDFISQLYASVKDVVEFGASASFASNFEGPIISTIPMPALMKALAYPHELDFKSRQGVTVVAKVEDADAYFSLYVPDPLSPFSRISMTGDKLMIECHDDETLLGAGGAATTVHAATTLLGFTERQSISEIQSQRSRYAKILPIDEHERKKFIIWATETHGVYSVGRFATWRPGLLLDDVVQDVRVVQRLRSHQHAYEHKKDAS